jgi:translation initiation factor IF-2
MRIYEFAQLNNVSSKDIIEKLQKNGFDVKSHMSVLDEKALAFLQKPTAQSHVNAPKVEPLKESKPANPIEDTVTQLSQATATAKAKKTQAKPASAGVMPQQPTLVKKEAPAVVSPVELVIHQMGIAELAEKIKKPVTDIIVTLLKWGIVATKNQIISEDVVQRLAHHYEIPVV